MLWCPMLEGGRERNKKHLIAVSQLGCILCGVRPVQVAHIRMRAPGKPNPGMGQKPSDRYVVPLCYTHHTEQHSMGERRFWELKGVDPLAIADKLYNNSRHLNTRGEDDGHHNFNFR